MFTKKFLLLAKTRNIMTGINQNTDNGDTGYLALMEEDNKFPAKVNDRLANVWGMEED